MTTATQEQFYEAHKDAEGNLTDEQTLEMMSLPEQGDTAQAESSDKPDVAASKEAVEKVAEEATTQQPAETVAATDPEPVVLTSDGKHTIPFSELKTAREEAKLAKHWEMVAAQQAAEIEALKKAPAAAPAAPAEQPKTEPATAETNPFGDYSDEAMKKGIETLVSQKVAAVTAQLEAKFAKEMEPMQRAAQAQATDAHYRAIYGAHPDADAIGASPELKVWIDSQPSFVKSHFATVITDGTAEQVVELLTAFKSATQKAAAPAPAPQPTVAAAKAKAAEAIAKAQATTPTTLSDLPAGTGAHVDEAEAVLDMSSEALLRKMEGMSQEKRDALMASVL